MAPFWRVSSVISRFWLDQISRILPLFLYSLISASVLAGVSFLQIGTQSMWFYQCCTLDINWNKMATSASFVYSADLISSLGPSLLLSKSSPCGKKVSFQIWIMAPLSSTDVDLSSATLCVRRPTSNSSHFARGIEVMQLHQHRPKLRIKVHSRCSR